MIILDTAAVPDCVALEHGLLHSNGLGNLLQLRMLLSK